MKLTLNQSEFIVLKEMVDERFNKLKADLKKDKGTKMYSKRKSRKNYKKK